MNTYERNANGRHREMMFDLIRFYDDAPEADGIIYAAASEVEDIRYKARDLLSQLSAVTGTWGLSEWERVLDLPPRPNSSDELRRARILAKLRGAQPATLSNVLSIINAHVPNKDANIVELATPGVFDIEIPNQVNVNLHDLHTDIKTVKPAHLAYNIVFITELEEMILRLKNYEFSVSYNVCNEFKTDDVRGKSTKLGIPLLTKYYAYDVGLPVCNTFVTSIVNSVPSNFNVVLASEYRNNDILYVRTSENTLLGGEI